MFHLVIVVLAYIWAASYLEEQERKENGDLLQ